MEGGLGEGGKRGTEGGRGDKESARERQRQSGRELRVEKGDARLNLPGT